jgi:hypothetical protein
MLKGRTIGANTKGRERVIASVLITFVPCSAIILALAGKYLGGCHSRANGNPGVLRQFWMPVLRMDARIPRRPTTARDGGS